MAQSRRWCFTLNNYNDSDVACIEGLERTYICMGKEIGESGTKHLQGYIVFPRKMRLGGCKKCIPKAHWEITRGTHEEAANYCKKENDFYESGKYQEKQEIFWAEVRNLIRTGDMEKLGDEYPQLWCVYGDKWENRVEWEHEKNIEPDNLWIHGDSGCGKTRWVLETYPDAFHFSYKQGWWNGYRGQETVLMDDFDPYFKAAQMHDFKRWWDRYEFPARIKGCADKMIRPKRFIITSNHTIEDCFGKYDKDYAAIVRRFKVKNMSPCKNPWSNCNAH